MHTYIHDVCRHHMWLCIGRKFWSPYFCGSYAPWNLENTRKWPCHHNSSETTVHETWYLDRTSYDVMHIGRKFWSPHFCRSYVPWNLENTYKWPCHCNNLIKISCSIYATAMFIAVAYIEQLILIRLSLQLLWNCWSIYHETWYVDRTSYWQEILIPSFLWELCL